jgi:predicted ribosomally synthesized peptide with nif11-like leader
LKEKKIMPAKSVDAFFEKVAQDKSLQAELKALHLKTLKVTTASKDKASAEVARIAAAAGFKFTARDLTGARSAKPKKPAKAELSEVTGQWMDCTGGCYDYCRQQSWTCIEGIYY